MKREKNGNLTLATLPSWIRLQMFSFLLRKLPSFRNSVFFSCLEASLNARAIVSEKKTGRKWCWKLSADCIYHFIFHIIYKSFSIHPNKFDTPYQEFSRFLWALFLFCSKNFFLLEVQFLGEGRHQNIGSESQQHNLCTKHTFYPSSLFISSCISARQLICICVWGAVSKREREGDIKIFFLLYFFSKLNLYLSMRCSF